MFQSTFVRVSLRTHIGDEAKLGELKHHVLIFKLVNKWRLIYEAFCGGSIITNQRVLTSARCFLTNRKRYRHNLRHVKVVAGILHTYAQEPIVHDTQQWRALKHLYSQKFYRFPAYDLAVVETNKPWVFNQFVNKIPYASLNQDFDGVCLSTSVRPTQETQGGGLICYGTGDPEEKDVSQGILVGVTSLINIGLPSLHNRVGLFQKWVTDDSHVNYADKFMLFLCVYFLFIKTF